MSKAIKNLLHILRVPDNWFFLRSHSVLLVSHDVDHGFTVDGKHYSPLLDSAALFLTKHGIIFETFLKPYTMRARRLNFNKNSSANYSFLLMDFVAAVFGIFGSDCRKKMRQQLRTFLWSVILKKGSSQSVVAIQPEESLCRAARAMNIKVFDFQHGVITETIPAYRGEYALKKDIRDLPNGFFCWDQASANVLQTWSGKKGLDVQVVGNPWLTLFSEDYISDNPVWFGKKTAAPGGEYPKRVLITLQWGLSSFFPQYFSGKQFLREEILHLFSKTENEVFWYVRMHPIQVQDDDVRKNIVEALTAFKNVDVIWSTSAPLPIVLDNVQAHMTWDSSTVIEASAIGMQSYILNPGGFALPQDADKAVTFQDKELPYHHYEQAGFVTRSPQTISLPSLTDWLNRVPVGRSGGQKKQEFRADRLIAALSIGQKP